ncbi:hypothetical protein EV560_106150 [Bosea sp. BK604]|nr:hypothetical protein EV560_106150 [Bosea sp. BK604]
MPTSTEMIRRKREADAWEERMQRIRAAEAAKREWPAPFVPPVEPESEKKNVGADRG